VRVATQDITLAEFVRRFERPRLPVVLTGLCDPWPAADRWKLDRLLERFGDHKFKVGSRRRRCLEVAFDVCCGAEAVISRNSSTAAWLSEGSVAFVRCLAAVNE